MTSTAPTGSTTPDRTPYTKALAFDMPRARSGMEIIAPSGKFWIAIPMDSARAPLSATASFPIFSPA